MASAAMLKEPTEPRREPAGWAVHVAGVVKTFGSGEQRVVAVKHDPGEGDLYAVGTPVWVQVLAENAYLLGEG